MAWALTARKGSAEKCNCDIKKQAHTDNHIVLVDPAVKASEFNNYECSSVTAEFTPRVRLDHPSFTRLKLNPLIDPTWKPSQSNPNGKLLVRVTGLLMFIPGHFFHEPLTRAH